ncbi:MFS transporter [Streptomyces sp. 71268]|uniref:MFS transporter n=1 Tax=Streptomyces sp. 71268 TaxID=3002640 RepID=UPI0023F657A0|nr:MFS transporter [Streptomyces sp. 71268]WEV26829.1 MFS transporter [Streptomyces sp. 71268]
MLGVRDDFRRRLLAIAALFCVLGFQYATWAARLPALKSDLDLSKAEVGLLLMAAGVGAAISFPLVAVLTRRLGSRRLAVVSGLFLGAVLLGLAAAPNYPLALAVMCLDGLAVGCLNVAMNAQGAALEARHDRTAMAKLHAVFSAGSLFAALLASGMNALTHSVAAHFGAAAAIIALLVVATRPHLLPDEAPAEQTTDDPAGTQTTGHPAPADQAADQATDQAAADQANQAGQADQPRRRLSLPATATLWMGGAMVFGTVTEGAMNDWSALYLEEAGASAKVAPLGIAVVSVMMVAARLFADGWRARWGDGRVVRVGSVLAGTGLALALLAGGVVPALLGFACMGLGIAAVTPCVYVAAARQGSDALALVAAMGTTGLLAGPPVIGFIAQGSSMTWGMGAVAASAVLVAACATRIRWTAAAQENPKPPHPRRNRGTGRTGRTRRLLAPGTADPPAPATRPGGGRARLVAAPFALVRVIHQVRTPGS